MNEKEEGTEAAPEKKSAPESAPKKDSTTYWRWLLVVGIIAIIAALIFWVKSSQNNAEETSPSDASSSDSSEQNSSDETVMTDDTTQHIADRAPRVPNPDGQTFESADLGISFYYANKSNGSSIETRLEGNKVLIGQKSDFTDSYQSIEKFDKDPNETLELAIYGQILAEISLDDCTVEAVTKKSTDQYTWEKAQIVPLAQAGAEETGGPVENSACPAKYTASNGISYFLMDSNYPDRFYFISIGQYGILAADGDAETTWQDTLQIF